MTTSKYYAPRDFQNLSSALSYRIYGELRNVKMRWVPLSSCQDYVIAGGYNLSHVGHKAHVWSSGYTKPYGPSNRPEKIYSVRGPLSQARAKQHMNISVPASGDPLLLISDFHDVPEDNLKPCFFEKTGGSLSRVQPGHSVRRITINDSLDTILTSIKNSTYVLTDMLEGLVLADSFSVKSAFASDNSAPFAVRDYLGNFTSSSKDMFKICDIERCTTDTMRYRNTTQLKNTLISTMPDV